MTLILALDVSSVSTGFALVKDGNIDMDAYGTIAPKKKLQYGARLIYFQDEVRKLIRQHKPDIVAIEEIFKGRNMTTFKSLSMFRGVAVKTIHEEMGKDPVNILAVEARSTLGFSSSKDDAFKEAVKKYKLKNFDFEKDNDIIDAMVLGQAIYELLQQGENEKSLSDAGRSKKRRAKRNKKRLSKAGNGVPSGQKSRKQRGRGKV